MPVIPFPGIKPPSSKPGGTCSFRGLDIVAQAMMEIGALAQGETPDAGDGSFVLAKLNRMLDSWNIDGRYVYTVSFVQYPLVPNVQPYLIGPAAGANFVVNQRPVAIERANIVLNNVTPNIRYPLNIRDDEWWASKRAYAVSGSLATDLYYTPDWPNGSIYLWPVQTVAYLLELWTWSLINELALDSVVCLPPGYLDAIVLSLAVSLVPSFGVPPNPALMDLARKAVQKIQSANIVAPRMGTKDAGIPGGPQRRASFNYRTGQSR